MSIFQNKFYKKPIASVLIVAIVCLVIGPVLFLPRKATAVIPGCPVYDLPLNLTEKAQLAKRVQESIWQKIWEATVSVPTLLAAAASAAKDAWSKKYDFLEWTAGVMGEILIHQILAMITNDIVGWIKNGTTPRFLTEGLGDYLKEAVDNAAGNFVSQYLGAGWLCEPFDLDIKIALLDVPTFETEAECSISDIVDNINDFYDDFSAGGWKGWIELSEPQNNFYGTLLLAQDEKARVEEEAKKEMEADAQAGEGFLGQKDCYWYDALGNLVEEQKDVRGVPKLPAACKPNSQGLTVAVRPCRPKCKTNTPSAVVNELAKEAVTDFQKTLRAKIGGLAAKTGPFAVYVGAIASALVNRVMKEGLLLIVGDPNIPKPPSQPPKTADPEKAIQNQDEGASLLKQLEVAKEKLKNELLEEQKNNLAVLNLIPPVYTDTLDILDQISFDWPAGCSSTPYSISYISWAEEQKDEIENHLIPFTDNQIDQLENVEIPQTIAAINEINIALVSIQDLIEKADKWLKVFEEVKGVENDPALKAAGNDMNEAENKAIADTQTAIKTINGVVSSADIAGLVEETQIATANILYETQALMKERGMANWPDPGTLYAQLEVAQDKKDEANERLNTCLNWTPPEDSS